MHWAEELHVFANKTIQATTRLIGTMIVGTFLLAVIFTSVAFSYVRLGGPMDHENQVTTDFVADILPPALFLVEPMLHATLIASDPEETDEQVKILDKLEATFNERYDFWQKSDLKPELKQHVAQKLKPVADKFWKHLHEKLIPAGHTLDQAKINAAHDGLEMIYAGYAQEIDKVVAEANAHSAELKAQSATVSLWSTIGLAVIGLTLMAQLVWTMRTLSRRMLTPLAETADTMTRMANGDLNAGRRSDHGSDEIGDMTRAIEVFRTASAQQVESAQQQQRVVEALSGALSQMSEGQLDVAITTPFAHEYEPLRAAFNNTVARLGDLIRDVARSASQVRTGASEILSAADDLAMRNERQAGSIEETAAAMRHVTTNVGQSASSTAGVRDTIGTTHAEVVAGGATVNRMVATMAEVETSSNEINQIIAVIEGISFQTNLLALNAGVEAARAGEAGKGFAVVANEVRALAQRSSDAAREISGLIQTSSLRVGEGVTLVGQTGTLLTTIVDRMGTINASAAEIASAADAQALNLEQVNNAVSEMDRAIQQNAAMVEETTAAARSLAAEADALAHLISRFSVGGDGNVIGLGATRQATRSSGGHGDYAPARAFG